MAKKDSSDTNSEIPGMDLSRKYADKNNVLPADQEKLKKEMDKTKKEIDKLKNWIVKKYSFTQSLSILPPQAVPLFVKEEEVPKETEKYMQLYMIIPEKHFKEIPKIKNEIVKYIDTLKLEQKMWIQVKTPIDVWENCLDSKFELTEAVGMSFPIYDTGYLGALRLSEIHKSLVLQKFEKYVVSYVVYGSFIRGEATPTSDVDVVVIINDTDVKRMPRLELKERLRSIIAGAQLQESMGLAGVKNTLHIQTYLLTEFWEMTKDAHPLFFTIIRDGSPLYDRGTFMPWKTLLKMGKLKPSPESIDMFMKSAEKTKEMAERRMIDAMIDVYYGVLNPSQALLMLYGSTPPTHKETPKLMDEIFVKKEKMLKKAEIKILEKAVGLFREYEHDLKFKIKGKEIDNLLKDSEAYVKRLKDLREQIEKRTAEKTIEQVYEDVFDLLKTTTGKRSQADIIVTFDNTFVKKGKFTNRHLKILKEVVAARTEAKKGKLSIKKIDEARRNASILVNDLMDYNQRADLVANGKK